MRRLTSVKRSWSFANVHFSFCLFFHSEERNIDFIVSVWTWGVNLGLILRWKTFVLCIKNCGKMGIASTIMSSKPIAPFWTYCNKNRSQNVSMAWRWMSYLFQNAVNKIFWFFRPMFFWLQTDINVNGSIYVNGVCRYLRFSADSHPPVADRQRFPQ